jgi:3-oxoacyl-[acyl-carrier-protein] synthase II
MEPWQRLGTYARRPRARRRGARGLVADMDLVVAAGGGERDLPLDESVLEALAATPGR